MRKLIKSFIALVAIVFYIVGCGGGGSSDLPSADSNLLKINSANKRDVTSVFASVPFPLFVIGEVPNMFPDSYPAEITDDTLIYESPATGGRVVYTFYPDEKKYVAQFTNYGFEGLLFNGKATVYFGNSEDRLSKIEFENFKIMPQFGYEEEIEINLQSAIYTKSADGKQKIEFGGKFQYGSKSIEFKNFVFDYQITSTLANVSLSGLIKYDPLGKYIKISTISNLEITVRYIRHDPGSNQCPSNGIIKIEGSSSTSLEIDFTDSPIIHIKLNGRSDDDTDCEGLGKAISLQVS